MMNRIMTLLGTACLLVTGVFAQTQNPDARVSLRVEGRALSEVVEYLREQSGSNMVVLEGGETPVSLDLTDVLWSDALELAAELAGCVVEESTAGVLVISRPPRIDFAFDNAELTDVIDTIAKLSGANVVVAPEVSGTLSLRLTDVPWRDALDVAVKTLGFVIVEDGRDILRVVDPLSLQAQMETRSYQFRYLRPRWYLTPRIQSEFIQGQAPKRTGKLEEDFPIVEALRKALSPGGKLDYISTQNVVIVNDTAQVHAEIEDIIGRVDVEPAQVFVDVKFVSTSNGDLFSLGVDYGDLGPQVSASGGQIPITVPFDLGSGGWEDIIIASPNGEGPYVDPILNGGSTIVPDTIFGALSFTGVAGTLRMLQTDSSTEVVQAPKLIALDGQEATIFVGETIRYAEAKTEQGQAGGLSLSVSEAQGSPVEVGFQLLVVPHVVPGTAKVIMDVIPKETTLTGTGDPSVAPPGFDVFTVGASGLEGSIALPRKRSSTIMTSMMLDSGQTAIIGGLTTENHIERESKVPYLAEIPILGALFRHEEESDDQRTLLVFITPTVVRSSYDTERLLQTELRRRQDAYGERLRSILFDTATAGASFEELPLAPAVDADPAEMEVSTFVESSEAPATEPAPESAEAATTED
jgi:type IV pilus assembly protein PilQ